MDAGCKILQLASRMEATGLVLPYGTKTGWEWQNRSWRAAHGRIDPKLRKCYK